MTFDSASPMAFLRRFPVQVLGLLILFVLGFLGLLLTHHDFPAPPALVVRNSPVPPVPASTPLPESMTTVLPAQSAAAAPITPAPSQVPDAVPEAVPLVPAAFVDPDPDDHFTSVQLNALNNIRREFAQAMGRENLNPNDPEYYRRWQKWRADSNERFQAMFGQDTSLVYQLEAAHLGQAN